MYLLYAKDISNMKRLDILYIYEVGNQGVDRMTEAKQQNLTKIEGQILELITHGHVNSEIAKRMFISSHTVKAHVSIILKKLKATNRTHAAYLAVKSKLVN